MAVRLSSSVLCSPFKLCAGLRSCGLLHRSFPTIKSSLKTPSRGFAKRTDAEVGLAYMGGIRNFNDMVDHTPFIPDKQITVGYAKSKGFKFHVPVREYYDHWKDGKTHLLVSCEFDYLHCWVAPPEGQSHPGPTAVPEDAPDYKPDVWNGKDYGKDGNLHSWTPRMTRKVEYGDDWVITDFHTFYTWTPIWVPSVFQRFLDIKLLQPGSKEYNAHFGIADDSVADPDAADGDGNGEESTKDRSTQSP
mmetsp:Transcript_7092/g.13423  ORF Transcript_7092/g.13423 Transcript_7092/m.13423 type:complete len:247 (+) Transcript_7092:1011-1751(+)|eukprot:CAMPEP_0175160310 /NCGR_PEP_ID=MMETSP0087-20121206/23940_1 /TAXON_ID=136419 /ORGANISM="Unknown Unknown, Strain D1" /LENGTH=246 /DNA_ID=CAMNT_0016448523 /DNA_START=27 /DNA_END=767 /DNA_ORIENTATION=+